jgi:hypothetical protein
MEIYSSGCIGIGFTFLSSMYLMYFETFFKLFYNTYRMTLRIVDYTSKLIIKDSGEKSKKKYLLQKNLKVIEFTSKSSKNLLSE